MKRSSRVAWGAVVGLLGAAWGFAAPAATAWRAARPDYVLTFPRDHWAHPGYRTEWWYLTGHLAADTDPGRRFGYQFTLFRIGLLPAPPASRSAWATRSLVMGHAAVTDLAAGRHVFSELLYRETPLLAGFGRHPDPLIAWSRAPAGTDGIWSLRWTGEGFAVTAADRRKGIALRLTTGPGKPLVAQGRNGFFRKGDGLTAASHYYSFTRLRTAGTLTLASASLAVRGESWMDKEFGSDQLDAHQAGWDWFGLQLEDGRELMLYLLRDREGGVDVAGGSLVDRTGTARALARAEWSVRATATWTSPESGAEYPSRWEVEIPGERLWLEIVPEVADQENRSVLVPDLFYWEGVVTARDPAGLAVGRGYVELAGYGTSLRPAL